MAPQRLEQARQQATEAAARLNQVALENRQASERFYNTLGLVAGGTIALSITFYGYLRGATSILWLPLLPSSWGFLLVALVGSLFRNLFYSHYLHYNVVAQYAEAMSNHRRTEAEGIQILDVVNLRGPEELPAAVERLTRAAAGWTTQATRSRRQERVYERIWLWTQRISQVSFVLGLILLLAFACGNM